jgi:hypothetical protein
VKLTDLFIGEIDREGPLTRRALEAVPEGRADWKPHAKSMPLGRLAGLVAMMPSWLSMMIEKDELDLSPPAGTKSQFSRELKTRQELVDEMEKGFAGARKALQGTTDDHLMKPWQAPLDMRGVEAHVYRVSLPTGGIVESPPGPQMACGVLALIASARHSGR